MVAAGQPSRGNPQESAGSDTGASLQHASGPQSFGVLDLSTLSTLPKTIASTAISGLDLGATVGALGEPASVVTRDSRTAATANVGPGSRHEPTPVLIGFRGTTVVRVVKELQDNIVAYRGREEPGDLESFLDGAMSGIDSALRVALTLALLEGGQAATQAGTRLLQEAESNVRFTSAGRTLPETTNRATIDAESACRCSWVGSASRGVHEGPEVGRT